MSETRNVQEMAAEAKGGKAEAKKAMTNLAQLQLDKYAQGRMPLRAPIQDGENKVTELRWDFFALTGAEYCDAMDLGVSNSSFGRITTKQALNLFAAAAAKVTGGVDATDIRERIGVMDAQQAANIATLFFYASNQVASTSIFGE